MVVSRQVMRFRTLSTPQSYGIDLLYKETDCSDSLNAVPFTLRTSPSLCRCAYLLIVTGGWEFLFHVYGVSCIQAYLVGGLA